MCSALTPAWGPQEEDTPLGALTLLVSQYVHFPSSHQLTRSPLSHIATAVAFGGVACPGYCIQVVISDLCAFELQKG